MTDAVISDSSDKIRNLFAILLALCDLSNPLELWEEFKNELCRDIHYRWRQQIPDADFNGDNYNEGLADIGDKLLMICGKKLSDFNLSAPDRQRLAHIIPNELQFDMHALQLQVTDNVPLLNQEQLNIYELVMDKINSQSGVIIFLDAPGGTGKTFLLNLILASVRNHNNVALAVASSGIASTLLEGGSTAHPLFKLPLNLNEIEHLTCNITKNSSIGRIINDEKLLIWDEATMSHKRAFEACDRT